jgi:uncharacterized membrane protein HdeD (DUF308 family)
MTDETSPRLQEFQAQVDDLRLSGVVAVALGLAAYFNSTSLDDARDQNEMIILALVAVVLALGSVGLFVRASMTRYFRYWLVRLVYEDRANTDRLIEAIREDD